MAEFDEKLNHILSNPDAMAQIMQLAESLGSGQERQTSCNYRTEEPNTGAAPPCTPASQSNDLFSSLLGDPSLLLKIMPLIQELSGQKDSNAKALLYALRPYLKPERQDKIERALQLARLFRVGKKFLTEWEGF